MNTNKSFMQEQVDNTIKSVGIATAFLSRYPEILTDRGYFSGLDDGKPKLTMQDAALAGKLFGKDGWVRKQSEYGNREGVVRFDWHREIAGLAVKIEHAETQEVMDNVPVPPAAFPLQLEDMGSVEEGQ